MDLKYICRTEQCPEKFKCKKLYTRKNISYFKTKECDFGDSCKMIDTDCVFIHPRDDMEFIKKLKYIWELDRNMMILMNNIKISYLQYNFSTPIYNYFIALQNHLCPKYAVLGMDDRLDETPYTHQTYNFLAHKLSQRLMHIYLFMKWQKATTAAAS